MDKRIAYIQKEKPPNRFLDQETFSILTIQFSQTILSKLFNNVSRKISFIKELLQLQLLQLQFHLRL